ncbi:uncharacterized protein LOC132589014 [Heteronotia binoei]|uniref:uncharacterized protein LOC132589014 n=1 Tax=Heteronotia binoei TaxID=13085 RepID=UPI00292E6612|nr:uncharacterized protein LOC132589014 [Heteronotia binoei]
MGILSTKTEAPASENQGAKDGRTPEIHKTQPASETPSDVSQRTTRTYCVEDSTKRPIQQGNKGHIQVICEEREAPQEASQPGATGSSTVVCGASEKGEIAPELMELIEKLMADSDPPLSRTDIVCQPCEECLSREGSDLECDLYSSLMLEMEPGVPKKLFEAFLPPPPETLDSWDVIGEAKPCKGSKETHPEVPVAEAIGAQAANPAPQQQSPENVGISDAASQTVPAGKGAGVDTGMMEEEEIWVCSRALGTQEGAHRLDGQRQENLVESPDFDPFWFLGGL